MPNTSGQSAQSIANPVTTQSIVEHSQGAVQVLDAQGSTFDNNVVGGTQGLHTWQIYGEFETVSANGTVEALSLATIDSNTSVSGANANKSATGNSWNSAAYSVEAFDPFDEDFMLLCEVESVSGTIREMVGASADPMANSSYNTQDFAIYQVNGTNYSRVYENGSAIVHDGQFNLAVGDRIGVRVVGGLVDYVRVSGSNIQSFFTSNQTPNSLLHFRAAFNRGSTSSGPSAIKNAQVVRGGAVEGETIHLAGQATEVLSAADEAALARIGMQVQAGSTYARIAFIKNPAMRFASGGPLNLTHGYGGIFDQSSVSLN